MFSEVQVLIHLMFREQSQLHWIFTTDESRVSNISSLSKVLFHKICLFPLTFCTLMIYKIFLCCLIDPSSILWGSTSIYFPDTHKLMTWSMNRKAKGRKQQAGMATMVVPFVKRWRSHNYSLQLYPSPWSKYGTWQTLLPSNQPSRTL